MSKDPQVFNDPDMEVIPCPYTAGVLRYRSVRSGSLSGPPKELHEKLVELITQLQVKRPSWQFTIPNSLTRDVHIFTKDKEYLGEIEFVVGYYGAERDYFKLNNFRIRDESIKATAGRCYSVKKAVERTLAKFRPRNMEEMVKARLIEAKNRVNNVVATRRVTWMSSRVAGPREAIMHSILNNPHVLDNTPLARLVTPELIQEWHNYSTAMVLSDATNFEIITETERDGVKQLYNITGMPEAYWLDAEQHENLISRVAMLRMVDVGQVIAGVGFRSDEHTFVVLGKAQQANLT